MAKRKATGSRRRKKAKKTAASRARKGAPRRRGAARKISVRNRKKRTAARKTTKRAKARASRPKARASRRSSAPARKTSRTRVARTRTKRAAARKPPAGVSARKAPALDRARRIVEDDDLVPTPPSSLDLDRTASAARSGRRGLREKFAEHTETSPALTGGDIDADWESAYSVGDEAPGGDNPTPDQDIVDDIGRAVGVQYEDNEELKGEKKISDRDRKRWELDPASSEDYDER